MNLWQGEGNLDLLKSLSFSLTSSLLMTSFIIYSCPITSPSSCTSPLSLLPFIYFLLTDDIKVSCDLFGAEAVGDFTYVVSRVFQTEVADCEAS